MLGKEPHCSPIASIGWWTSSWHTRLSTRKLSRAPLSFCQRKLPSGLPVSGWPTALFTDIKGFRRQPSLWIHQGSEASLDPSCSLWPQVLKPSQQLTLFYEVVLLGSRCKLFIYIFISLCFVSSFSFFLFFVGVYYTIVYVSHREMLGVFLDCTPPCWLFASETLTEPEVFCSGSRSWPLIPRIPQSLCSSAVITGSHCHIWLLKWKLRIWTLRASASSTKPSA